MILSMEEARDTLRLDGNDNDDIIKSLLEAIPSYLLTTTGRSWNQDEEVHPLAQTTAKFILRLWYDPQQESVMQLKRTINNMLGTLSALGRSYPEEITVGDANDYFTKPGESWE